MQYFLCTKYLPVGKILLINTLYMYLPIYLRSVWCIDLRYINYTVYFFFAILEEKITMVLVFGQHILFLLVTMFLTAYLQVPRMSRILILLVTFINSVVEIQTGKGAEFTRMAGVNFSIIMGI